VTAARQVGGLTLATLQPGTAARATLAPVAQVRFPVAPARPGAAGTAGGLFAVPVARAGRYRVALAGPAWIDMVRDGRAAAAVAHGHGPACTTIRKVVEFDLTPGRWTLEVTGSAAATLVLMVAPA
jgi:hypothetical protein